jgi:hypothetical protein
MIIKIFLPIIALLTSIPAGIYLAHLTKDEKYLKKFILCISIVCFALFLIFAFINLAAGLTLLYMAIISFICCWKFRRR